MSHTNVMPSLTSGFGQYDDASDDNSSSSAVERTENSNLISVSSTDKTLWRGKIWSNITFKVKTDKYFVDRADEKLPPPDSESDADEERDDVEEREGDHDEDNSRYVLIPSILNCSTGAVYHHGDANDWIRFKFEKNTKDGSNGAIAYVERAAQNTLTAEIHRDLFEDGEGFVVDVAAYREGDAEIIFGRSKLIHVTNLALCIEQDFASSSNVKQLEGKDEEYAWYSKVGGDKSGLSVTLCLKDAMGRVVDPSIEMPLQTELLYSDGTPAPEQPIAPLKARRSSELSKTPLFRPLVAEPSLGPSRGTQSFTFRIEEVSFHHPDKGGFKLKVSSKNPAMHSVHPGILEETIIVLSKPKHDKSKSTKKRGGRTSFVGSMIDAGLTDDEEERPKKKRRVSKAKARKVTVDDEDVQGGLQVALPLSTFLDTLCPDGKCLACKKKIDTTSFLDEAKHKKGCQLRDAFLPSVMLQNPVQSPSSDEGAMPPTFEANASYESYENENPPPIQPAAPFYQSGMGGDIYPQPEPSNMYLPAPDIGSVAAPMGISVAHLTAGLSAAGAGDDDVKEGLALSPWATLPFAAIKPDPEGSSPTYCGV